jgi:hypothetical protein
MEQSFSIFILGIITLVVVGEYLLRRRRIIRSVAPAGVARAERFEAAAGGFFYGLVFLATMWVAVLSHHWA